MAKQTTGKDDNGVFHPRKGKPSGVNKQEGLGIQATPPEKLEEYFELTDKYTIAADVPDPSLPLRHPNRNTSKGEDSFKAKEHKPAPDKSASIKTGEERSAVVAEELPGTLTRDMFKELANHNTDICISIYLVTHTAGMEVNEHYDPISFKNQLQEAGRKLAEKGKDENFIKQLLEPGFELVRNEKFWTTLSHGFAVFIAEGYFKYIRMPVVPAEALMVIQPGFYLTPLVAVMTSKEYFYLLVISKQCAKLFRADAWGMQIVPVGLPQGIDEVKRISGPDATTFRSGSNGPAAPRYAQEGAYHGVGGGNPDDKDNILTYFEAVDDMLWEKVLNKENAPLLLAGVEYEIPIYRGACDYHNVWPEALTGSREHQPAATLYQDAKQIMKPHFEQRLTKALDLFRNNRASEKTSIIPSDIIPATYYAQVSHLFVTKGVHIRGSFDEKANTLQIHETPGQEGEDLIDHAVVKTIVNGGEVFLLDKEKMPVDTQIAALMRF